MASESQIVEFIVASCLTMLLLIIVLFIFFNRHNRKMLAKEKRIKDIEFAKQIEVFNAAAAAEENEKQRIACNLHDEIIPILNVLRQNLTLQKYAVQGNENDKANFDSNVSSIDKAIEGIRNTSYDLVPSFLLTFGLEKGIEDYINSLSKSHQINAAFINSLPCNINDRFQKNEQLVIYRLSLEIINNILKHSKPTTLSVLWFTENDKLNFDFEHDGKGISNVEIEMLSKNSKGLGLNSIKARCILLNATISYILQPDHSYVRVALPMIV